MAGLRSRACDCRADKSLLGTEAQAPQPRGTSESTLGRPVCLVSPIRWAWQ